MKKHVLITVIFLFIGQLAKVYAQELKPSTLFCDNMVLQQGVKVPILGTSKPNEKIIVKFAN